MWSRFRRLPVWVQVVGWLLLWPLLGPLLIVRGEQPSRMRYAVAVALLLIGAVVFIPIDHGDLEQQTAAELAAEEQVLAVDAAAATLAEADAEQAARRVEHAEAARAADEEVAAVRAAEEAAARAAEEEAAAARSGASSP
jgi:hypothetical protein